VNDILTYVPGFRPPVEVDAAPADHPGLLVRPGATVCDLRTALAELPADAMLTVNVSCTPGLLAELTFTTRARLPALVAEAAQEGYEPNLPPALLSALSAAPAA
jgi:uncharacterized repeat protein (TIGR03917 family)